MNIEAFVIGILVMLLLGTNVFWAYITMQLSNRLMSRNFSEFLQSKTKSPASAPAQPLDIADPVSERQAQELNAIMGIV